MEEKLQKDQSKDLKDPAKDQYPKGNFQPLIQNALYSIIFATIFALLVVIGYNQAAKSPNPMHRILKAQEDVLSKEDVILEKLDRISENQRRTDEKLNEILAFLDSDERGDIAGVDEISNKSGECAVVLNKIQKLSVCSRDLSCVGNDFPHLTEYVKNHGSLGEEVSIQNFTAEALRFIDKMSKDTVVANKLGGFIMISKKTKEDGDAEILRDAMYSLDPQTLSNLETELSDRSMAEFAAILREKNELSRNIRNDTEALFKKALKVC